MDIPATAQQATCRCGCACFAVTAVVAGSRLDPVFLFAAVAGRLWTDRRESCQVLSSGSPAGSTRRSRQAANFFVIDGGWTGAANRRVADRSGWHSRLPTSDRARRMRAACGKQSGIALVGVWWLGLLIATPLLLAVSAAAACRGSWRRGWQRRSCLTCFYASAASGLWLDWHPRWRSRLRSPAWDGCGLPGPTRSRGRSASGIEHCRESADATSMRSHLRRPTADQSADAGRLRLRRAGDVLSARGGGRANRGSRPRKSPRPA